MQTLIQYKDITVTKDGNTLILKNQCIQRILDLSCGAPKTIALQDGMHNDFAAADKAEADLSFIGLHRPMNSSGSWEITGVSAKIQSADLFDGESVVVTVVMHETLGDTWYRREYFLYPELAVVAVQNSVKSAVTPIIFWPRRTHFEGIDQICYPVSESCADSIALSNGITVQKAVQFHGRTDFTDGIVEEKFCPGGELLNGNLLFCQNPETHHGLFFLQEAPPGNERRDFETYDFRVSDNQIYSCCWGIHPAEFVCNQGYQGYRHVLGIFHDETERDVVLKTYLKRRFPFDMRKNAAIMVNPWGCGHFPEVASEEFIMQDMIAGAEAGATHYQIDDGWQAGGGLAELSMKNRKLSLDFWQISDRFTDHSFSCVADCGKKHGIEPALWLAPSCNCDYSDWNEFADLILEFHRKYGIRFFKIDAVKIRTYLSEQNLRALLTKVRKESNGEVLFNLDTTNGQRPGYFHFLEFGNIFLENRYTCHAWGLGYHPEKVLHSLWLLSQYMNPCILQIEMPNPDNVNTEFYAKYPYGDPRCYPMEYMAMLTMFASPLLWCTPSALSAENRKIIRSVMELHKEHREKIADGVVFSIGHEPDGHHLTGLQSHDFSRDSGYLLFFREKNCTNESEPLVLKNIPKDANWKCLAGRGEILPEKENGIYRITVPDRPGFLFLAYGK